MDATNAEALRYFITELADSHPSARQRDAIAAVGPGRVAYPQSCHAGLVPPTPRAADQTSTATDDHRVSVAGGTMSISASDTSADTIMGRESKETRTQQRP